MMLGASGLCSSLRTATVIIKYILKMSLQCYKVCIEMCKVMGQAADDLLLGGLLSV